MSKRVRYGVKLTRLITSSIIIAALNFHYILSHILHVLFWEYLKLKLPSFLNNTPLINFDCNVYREINNKNLTKNIKQV